MSLTDKKLWRVTTEGDCEGRSIKNLGTFNGNIVDIAKRLSSLSYYVLDFCEIEHTKLPSVKTIRNSVDIRVHKLGQMNLLNELSLYGCDVEKSKYYKSVHLNIKVDEVKRLKKKIALDKLSEEEKELLGLK